MPDERGPQDVMDEETASVLPQREAMSLVAPPIVSSIVNLDPNAAAPVTTDQGIDESNPAADV